MGRRLLPGEYGWIAWRWVGVCTSPRVQATRLESASVCLTISLILAQSDHRRGVYRPLWSILT